MNNHIQHARDYLAKFDSKLKSVTRTLKILDLFEKEFASYPEFGLSSLGVSAPEEDEVLLGFSLPHWRVGLTVGYLADGEDKSTWYTVADYSDSAIGIPQGWGFIADCESDEMLVRGLVGYIVAYGGA